MEATAFRKFYSEGSTVDLFLDRDSNRPIPVKIIKLHRPFTLSCVMTVEVPGGEIGFTEPMVKAVLKLYDRRFAAQLRKDEGIDPWTEESEHELCEFVASGQIVDFVSNLRGEDDFEEPDEGWLAAENETYLYDMCSDLFSTESRAYGILKQLQGKQIPKLYSAVTLPLESESQALSTRAQAEPFLTINGILLEYIAGPTLSDMTDTIPRQSWRPIVDQAVQIDRSYSHLGILNRDVRCSNFIINEAVSDGDEHRVVMLDFALCEFKEPGRSEADWGRAKWIQDEEGAVGAVMRTKLAELGFKLKYAPSNEWIEYAERES